MLRGMDRWLVGYLRSILRRPRRTASPVHVMIGFMDHFEPLTPGGKASNEKGEWRVQQWQERFPRLAADFRDADGLPPRWSFFYPAEEYRPAYLDALAGLTAKGWGEVEIHLHHDGDTAASLSRGLVEFRDRLRNEHGLLGSAPDGSPAFAFIHGNWSLCNSLPDGRWCGVNDELVVLRESGCYCDMTMPAGASPAQSRTVNAIYHASNKPGRPRSHDGGIMVTAAAPTSSPTPREDAGDLMLIQGPLALNWGWRKWGLLPRLEYGDLTGACPPTAQRGRLWLRQHIHVANRPEWLFIKLHTHGCNERNLDMLLGEPMRTLHQWLATACNDGQRYRLHYVTAREMYNIVKAAEAGAQGDPGAYRDFVIAPPPAGHR